MPEGRGFEDLALPAWSFFSSLRAREIKFRRRTTVRLRSQTKPNKSRGCPKTFSGAQARKETPRATKKNFDAEPASSLRILLVLHIREGSLFRSVFADSRETIFHDRRAEFLNSH